MSRLTKTLFIPVLAGLLSGSGCDNQQSDPAGGKGHAPPPPSGAPGAGPDKAQAKGRGAGPAASSGAAAAAPGGPAGGAPSEPAKLQDGLVVEFRPSGVVVVTGVDQWGGKINTTYESKLYFQNAIPVLLRSLSQEQREVLKKAAEKAGIPVKEEVAPVAGQAGMQRTASRPEQPR